MIVAHAELWLAATNAWVIAPDTGGPCVLVDAPPDPEGIDRLLARHDLYPVAMLLTHGHIDHMGGAGGVAANHAGLATWVHPDDDFLTLDPTGQLRSLFGIAPPGDYAPPAEMAALSHGQVLSVGGLSFEVRHTPGHTPGHCCFLVEDEGLLFSGDQLFAGSIGRTDLPGGSMPELARSMAEQVMTLGDDVQVLPGHGPQTSIGRERLTNPFRDLWQ